jgi:hypothetical protein
VPSESKTKRTATQKNHPRVHGCAQGDYAGQGTRQGAGCSAETNGQVFSGGKTKSKSFTTTTKSTPDGALKSPIFKSAGSRCFSKRCCAKVNQPKGGENHGQILGFGRPLLSLHQDLLGPPKLLETAIA